MSTASVATGSTVLVLVELLSTVTGTTVLALRTMTTPLALITVILLDHQVVVR